MSPSLFDQFADKLSSSSLEFYDPETLSDEPDGLAKEFAENQSVRNTLFKLANKIYHDPNDIDAIEQYVALIITSSISDSQVASSDILDICDRMEAFLLDQVRLAATGKVEEIISVAHELDKIRRSVLSNMESQRASIETPVPEDKVVLQKLESWRADGPPTDVPSDESAVREALDQSRQIRAAIDSRNESPLDHLEIWIDKLETALEICTLLRESNQFIDAALSAEEPTESAYLMQLAEQQNRQLVVRRLELTAEQQSQVHALTRRVESASETIVERKRQRQDQRLWTKLEQAHSDIEDILSEDLPRARDNVKKGGGKFTKRIERREKVLREVNDLLPQFRTQDFRERAIDTIELLSDQLEVLQMRRQQTYNKFALHYIGEALDEGYGDTGKLGTKSRLGRSIRFNLGKIDRRYLTEEVNRAYSEVFEILFNGLKKAKSADDFEEPGRKLFTLKKMTNKEPTPIDSF